jgi:hypothetical protein
VRDAATWLNPSVEIPAYDAVTADQELDSTVGLILERRTPQQA